MNGKKYTSLAAIFLLIVVGVMHVSIANAQPTVLSDCQTIASPGSYVLTQNIDTNEDCFIINASDVTIDFNGFTIEGDGGVGDFGVFGVGVDGIAIRNGMIKNFNTGITLTTNADNVQIERMIIRGNTGVGIQASVCNIKDSVVNQNGGIGISSGGLCNISGNNVSLNGSHGIVCAGSCTICENTIIQNVGDGIRAVTSTITNNTSVGNDNGIFSANSPGTISGNTVRENAIDGINAGVGSNISNNTASENGENGIEVICPSNLDGNTAVNNVGANLNQIGTQCKRYNMLY